MTSPAPAYANESNVALYYWLDLSANNIICNRIYWSAKNKHFPNILTDVKKGWASNTLWTSWYPTAFMPWISQHKSLLQRKEKPWEELRQKCDRQAGKEMCMCTDIQKSWRDSIDTNNKKLFRRCTSILTLQLFSSSAFTIIVPHFFPWIPLYTQHNKVLRRHNRLLTAFDTTTLFTCGLPPTPPVHDTLEGRGQVDLKK